MKYHLYVSPVATTTPICSRDNILTPKTIREYEPSVNPVGRFWFLAVSKRVSNLGGRPLHQTGRKTTERQLFTALLTMLVAAFMLACPLAANAQGASTTKPTSLTGQPDIEAVLNELDGYIGQVNVYQEKKEKELEELKRSLAPLKGVDKLKGYERLIDEYRHFNIDSALHYTAVGQELAMKTCNELYQQRFEMHRSTVISIYGIVREAMNIIEGINVTDVKPENRILYFQTKELVYNYAKDFYPLPDYKLEFSQKSDTALDSLLNCLPPGSPEYEFCQSQRLMGTAASQNAIERLCKLLERIPEDSHMYARLAAIVGNAYINDPYHTSEAIYYLAKSAIADIKTGNRETTSLHRLGKLLFSKNEVERAHNYLLTSLSTSVGSGSRLRSLEIAEALPLLLESVQERDRQSRQTLLTITIILSIILLGAIVILVFFARNRKRLAQMKERLASSNNLKDNYIKQILNFLGVYLVSVENFNRLASRKIKAGQAQELLNMIESGKVMRDQLQTFYDVFDSALLMIYPDFVEQINALLQPDKKITPREGEQLTPELRIMAFMRLGVDDSNQISKFLGLSLNTVYTYRNKMKSRAQNRENFEEQVRKIGKIG